MSQSSSEKKPVFFKIAIVALPVGLALSAAIAMYLKIQEGPRNDLTEITYATTDFSEANLRDSIEKLENFLGERSFEGELGQSEMRSTAALIQGSLGPNNLGYQVQNDEGFSRNGKIWQNYWVSRPGGKGDTPLLVWTYYSNSRNDGAIAALLALSEWMRGRDFRNEVRVAFLAEDSKLSTVSDGLPPETVYLQVRNLGSGSFGFEVSDVLGAKNQLLAEGRFGESSASDWKQTREWDAYRQQVRALTEEVRKRAGERVRMEES